MTFYPIHMIVCAIICITLSACAPKLSFQPMSDHIIDEDIQSLIRHYQNRGQLNTTEQAIIRKMAGTFLTTLKTQLPEQQWDTFYTSALKEEHSIERSLIDAYGETIYGIGGKMFYATPMPYDAQTHYQVSQSGFANIMYFNETSLRDKQEIEYIFEYSSDAIQRAFLKEPDQQRAFQAKLDMLNDGYINVLLVSNQAQRKAFGLKYGTAQSTSMYTLGSQHFNFSSWIQSNYVNLLYSVSFLHELVHAFMAINAIDIEDMQLSRNDYTNIKHKLSLDRTHNIMLEEGLAEYITRHYSVWSKLPIFEPVLVEIQHVHNSGLPLLNLDDMQRYYYGKERRSFRHVNYGLLSAHALVDFIIQRYDIETVVKLIHTADLHTNAKAILGISWADLVKQWHQQVSAA